METHKHTLHWYEYDTLQSHIHTLDERSAISAKWVALRNSVKDSNIVNRLLPTKFDRLSDLSAELKTRLEDWAVLPTCAYTHGTKHLEVKLTFATINVVDPSYTYSDDYQLIAHLELQLQPAYAIITEYLEAPEVGLRAMFPLELAEPRYAQELPHIGFYLNKYEWDADKSAWQRKGIPFAVSVFLNYAPFDL